MQDTNTLFSEATGILISDTMGKILEHWSIPVATLFSIMLIIGAYVLARGIESPPSAQASTETALLKAIATKDSNGDGLPDWEKSLYGIPVNAATTDYFNLGMTDGEAVARGLIVPKAIADVPVATSSPSNTSLYGDASLPPPPADGTLTAAFAKSFFSLYLTAKQNAGTTGLSDADFQNIANEAVSSLSTSIAPTPDFKSASDLTVSGSGADAMKVFAANAETVLRKNKANATTSELVYLGELLNNDTTASTHLASIAQVYRDSAVGIAVLPVPQELAADDLTLVNSMTHMSGIISDFARANDDPLAAILALQQYESVAQSMGSAFQDFSTIYANAGISIPTGTPGVSFVNVIKSVAAKQKAAAAATQKKP